MENNKTSLSKQKPLFFTCDHKIVDQDEILKTLIKEIKKTYGKGAIMKLEDKSNLTIEAVATGEFYCLMNKLELGDLS